MGKKLVYAATPQRKSSILNYTELAAAGFFSAVPTTLVAAPVERVKVLLQVSSSPLEILPVVVDLARERTTDGIAVRFLQ